MLAVALGDGLGLVRAKPRFFQLPIDGEQVAGAERFVGDAHVAQGGAGERLLVAAVVDGEFFRVAERACVPAQDAHAERVEGGNLGRLRAASWRLPSSVERALVHFARRLVGEGDGQDAVGRDAVAMRLAMRYVTTRVLPVPAPASTSSGPRERVDGVALRGVQTVGWSGGVHGACVVAGPGRDEQT